jgi:hypothetical protein
VHANSDDLAGWQDTLAADVDVITELARQHAWSMPRCSNLELGVDRARITIPVRDAERRLIGLLRYQPAPRCGELKMLPQPGLAGRIFRTRGRTFGESPTSSGETHTVAARSRGLPAIAVPPESTVGDPSGHSFAAVGK